MLLAPFKLILTVINLTTYFAFPVFPIYLVFKTEMVQKAVEKNPAIFTPVETAKEFIRTWIKNPEVLVERKVVVCIIVYCLACFTQFHVMRFLFSLRIPGLTLKRQKVQKEVFF
jgi:hypothetical protein